MGNQGGIRSAAMLGFRVPEEAFVATATAIALLVGAARMPVCMATQFRGIMGLWPSLVAATAGVSLGTLTGGRVLTRVPENVSRRVVSGILLALGAATLSAAVR